MTPEQWEQVKELFEQARQAPPAARGEFLSAHAADAEIRQEVESLLEVYEEAPEYLEGERPTLRQECPAEAMTGRQVGAWRLLRELGRGGMGVVWEAERADGEYQQRVAVKLLPGGLMSRSGIARFREERRILALLEHPGIARLLDGGADSDGTPYLVMEYVEGQPLDAWCEGCHPPLRERLELFLQVCAAVAYAHRHLVIHRDLKPGNVLVTPDGTPKLLDFGIAKLLAPEDASGVGPTQPSERILTPGFASPEQVRGERASTASDVYSLGVLLYLMLSGRRPYAEDSSNPLVALRAVLEQDPPAPSAVAGDAGRPLRGELDAIVLHALRKNPEERYPSVRALAEDVRAWLEGRPVQAHPESRWRRGIKFVRRNRVPSLAAAAALFSLLAGTAVSLWQAYSARWERNRAESSFRELRQFSRSVLFELNDAVRNLPGSTPVRLLLVRRATEMLDNLARQAGGDTALQLELAEGYRRVGHLQGSSFSDNVGQVDAAIESFRKAVRLGEGAVATSRGGPQAAVLLLDAYEDLGDAILPKDPQQADAIYAKHRESLGRIERGPGLESRVLLAVATGYSALGFHQIQRNRFPAAKEDFRRAVEGFEGLARSGAKLSELNVQHAFALKRLGAILIQEKSLEEAERHYRRALEIEDADLAAKPGDRRRIIDRTMTLSDLAFIQRRREDLAGAARSYEEVVRVRRAALEADPKNQRLLSLAVGSEMNLASVYGLMGRYPGAIELSRAAVERRGEAQRQGVQSDWDLASARVILAAHLLAGAEKAPTPRRRAWLAEAQAALDRAAPVLERLREKQQSPDNRAAWDRFLAVRERMRKLTR